MNLIIFLISLLIIASPTLAQQFRPFALTTLSQTNAYYVATTGNDSNSGTLNSPFLTPGKCRDAMRATSIKVCYVRSGTYNMPTLALTSSDNNETWYAYPNEIAILKML